MLHNIIFLMAIGRVLIGLAPFVIPVLSSRLLGIPSAHDTPSGRLMARFFGVRDIGLGVLVAYALAHPDVLSFVVLFNALTDIGDLVAISIPLIRRQGIDRTAWTSAAFALPASLGWFAVLLLLSR